MGVLNSLLNKIIDAALGDTNFQKVNKILNIFKVSEFSNLIICSRLPDISKGKIYFLSASEIDRLSNQLEAYNKNLEKMTDSVIKPTINGQIEANKKICKYFSEIKKEIKNISNIEIEESMPIKELKKIQESCLGVVINMVSQMVNTKEKINSKKKRYAVKELIDGYVKKVLNAKPESFICWDDYMDWLVNVLNQNICYLDSIKITLRAMKFPDENSKKDSSGMPKKLLDNLKKVRDELSKNYQSAKVTESSFGMSDLYPKNLLNLFKNAAIDKGKSLLISEVPKNVVPNPIKLLSALSSSKVEFLDFKSAKLIKDQLTAYKEDASRGNDRYVYENYVGIIDKVLPCLDDYIKIKDTIKKINGKEYEEVKEKLEDIKQSMKTCIERLKKELGMFSGKWNEKTVLQLYKSNLTRVDGKEVDKIFKSIKNSKSMVFEDYAHELYVICDKSLRILDNVVEPENLKININKLGINAFKFEDNKLKVKNAFGFVNNVKNNYNNKLTTWIETQKKNKQKYSELSKEFENFCKENVDFSEGFKKDKEKLEKEIKELYCTVNRKIKLHEKNVTSMNLSSSKLKDLKLDELNNLGKNVKALAEKIQEYEKFYKSKKDELCIKKQEIEKLKENFKKIMEELRNIVQKAMTSDSAETEFNKLLKFCTDGEQNDSIKSIIKTNEELSENLKNSIKNIETWNKTAKELETKFCSAEVKSYEKNLNEATKLKKLCENEFSKIESFVAKYKNNLEALYKEIIKSLEIKFKNLKESYSTKWMNVCDECSSVIEDFENRKSIFDKKAVNKPKEQSEINNIYNKAIEEINKISKDVSLIFENANKLVSECENKFSVAEKNTISSFSKKLQICRNNLQKLSSENGENFKKIEYRKNIIVKKCDEVSKKLESSSEVYAEVLKLSKEDVQKEMENKQSSSQSWGDWFKSWFKKN
ncbi:MAG: hypothetical protein ACI4PR_04805 [Acutalibacteraceae bacterium]